MAGHSKWAQIKRQKGANDVVRSALFAKLARRITVESKRAKGDVNAASLRASIDIAKAANMPKENIERAVAKGSSPDANTLETVVYETYGPGGAAIIIEAVTDNRNRTSQEIKHLLSTNGLSLASPGSALWAFEKTAEGYAPQTTVKLPESEDASLMQLMQEIDAHDDVQEVYTNAA